MLTAISLSIVLIGCYFLIGFGVILSNTPWKNLYIWLRTAKYPKSTLLFASFMWPVIIITIIRHKLKK